MKFINEEIKKLKDKKVSIENNKNIQKDDSNYVLLYTEYTCPFFFYFFAKNYPYHFPPVLANPIKNSIIINFYIPKKIIVNPDATYIESKKLFLYLRELNKVIVEDNNIAVKIYEMESNNIMQNTYGISDIDSVTYDTIKQIIEYSQKIPSLKTEEEIIDIIPTSVLQKYTYFCQPNSCPYYHICKYKERMKRYVKKST